jgi:hypothetical protein
VQSPCDVFPSNQSSLYKKAVPFESQYYLDPFHPLVNVLNSPHVQCERSILADPKNICQREESLLVDAPFSRKTRAVISG